ncbi:MAG: ABC transporter permease subunit [Pirellulaceae bacterium]
MASFIGKRLLQLVPTLWIIITVSFFVMRLAPGSPFNSERAIPPEVRAEFERQYGLNLPLHQQYVRYLAHLCQGDFGLSTKYPQRSVNEIISIGFPVTLAVATVALLWALMVGITAGIVGAIRQNTVWDYAAMAAAMVGISIPTFVLGPLLVLVFSLTLLILPSGGWGQIKHLALPGITMGTVYAAYIARLTRGGMLEVVRADFIRTARAKGLSELIIVWRHMLKGGLLPVVTYLGPAITHMLVGSVVVEKIFNVPGIGPYFVDAAVNRDYSLVMGIVVLESVFLLLLNTGVDLAYGWLDPRVRYE